LRKPVLAARICGRKVASRGRSIKHRHRGASTLGIMNTTDLPVVTPSTALTARVRSPWLGTAAMAAGIFALVTSEFLPASVLSPIAADLRISEGMAGQAVTATAIAGLITAPTLPALVRRLDRRTLLIGLLALALLADVLVAIAPSYGVLLVSRVLLGVALAGFWSMALAVTAHLVPAHHLGRGLTVVNLGVSLATVAAVPLGAFLGDVWGWRPVFWLAAGFTVVAAVLLIAWLPSIPPSGSVGFRALFATLRSRVMIVGLLSFGLIVAGHFAAFTYVRPAAELSGAGAQGLAIVLAVYGVAALAGNLVAGPAADRRLRLAMLVAPLLLGAAVLAFAQVAGSFPAVVAAVALWGLAFGGMPTLVQTWSARTEPERLEAASGLVVMTFQLAIAAGAAVGGALVDGLGVTAPLIAGGIAAVVGGLALSSAGRRR
jgi:predicted MFS family arabinose efflux permease